MRRVAWWVLVVVLAISTPAAATVGGWQLLSKSRRPPPVADQPAARDAAVQAATAGTVKVLSYTPDTLDRDFAAAKACLTGDFLSYYDQFTRQVVAPAAQEKKLATTATVRRAGVEMLTSESATILVFVDQVTTSADRPSPSQTTSSVRVGLTKVKGSWLISKFDPV